MGFTNSWIGFQGLGRAEALACVGLVEDEDAEDFFIGELGNGWTILVGEQENLGFGSALRMAALSDGRTLVSADVADKVGICSAQAYRDGTRLWAALHNPEAFDAPFGLAVEGELPAELEVVRERLIARQREADAAGERIDHMWEMPLDFAEALTGFRHDVIDWTSDPRFVSCRRVDEDAPDPLAQSWEEVWKPMAGRASAAPSRSSAPSVPRVPIAVSKASRRPSREEALLELERGLHKIEQRLTPRWLFFTRCGVIPAAYLALRPAALLVGDVFPSGGRFDLASLFVLLLLGSGPLLVGVLLGLRIWRRQSFWACALVALGSDLGLLVESASEDAWWRKGPNEEFAVAALGLLGLASMWSSARLWSARRAARRLAKAEA